MKKKLFVFNSSKFWGYCGGMATVTAENFKQACKRLQDQENESERVQSEAAGTYVRDGNTVPIHPYNPTQFKFRTKEFSREPKNCGAVDAWILVGEFELADGQPDICLMNYNYA